MTKSDKAKSEQKSAARKKKVGARKKASTTRKLTPQEIKDLYELDEVDKAIIRHLATYPGATQEELAAIVGFSRTGIQKRLKKPSIIRWRQEQATKFMDLLDRVQNKAIRKLERLMDSLDENVALKATLAALTPVLNTANLNLNTVDEKIFRVQIGESGRIVQDVIVVKDEDKKERPVNSLDLLKEAGVK